MSPGGPWHDDLVNLSEVARRTHPRTAGPGGQLAVLLLAIVAGLGIAAVLHWADDRSWSGAVTTVAQVTGVRSDGVHATANGRDVVLHLERVPATGARLSVEVRGDGRARPSSYRQSWTGSLRRGLALSLGVALLVQAYRYVVTRRTTFAA
jgi:hypothetical protein